MAAAHAGDDAEAAGMIATFSDSQVSEMSGRQAKARRGKIRNELRPGMNVENGRRKNLFCFSKSVCSPKRFLMQGRICTVIFRPLTKPLHQRGSARILSRCRS